MQSFNLIDAPARWCFKIHYAKGLRRTAYLRILMLLISGSEFFTSFIDIWCKRAREITWRDCTNLCAGVRSIIVHYRCKMQILNHVHMQNDPFLRSYLKHVGTRVIQANQLSEFFTLFYTCWAKYSCHRIKRCVINYLDEKLARFRGYTAQLVYQHLLPSEKEPTIHTRNCEYRLTRGGWWNRGTF